MKAPKTQPVRTVLTIAVGFTVIHLLTGWNWPLYLALGVGVAGVFSDFLSEKIDFLWMKLAWLLNQIFPNILMSVLFYGFLFPIATLQKLTGNKDPLMLKGKRDTYFHQVDKTFDAKSMKNPW